jgi:hypothetical protein
MKPSKKELNRMLEIINDSKTVPWGKLAEVFSGWLKEEIELQEEKVIKDGPKWLKWSCERYIKWYSSLGAGDTVGVLTDGSLLTDIPLSRSVQPLLENDVAVWHRWKYFRLPNPLRAAFCFKMCLKHGVVNTNKYYIIKSDVPFLIVPWEKLYERKNTGDKNKSYR